MRRKLVWCPQVHQCINLIKYKKPQTHSCIDFSIYYSWIVCLYYFSCLKSHYSYLRSYHHHWHHCHIHFCIFFKLYFSTFLFCISNAKFLKLCLKRGSRPSSKLYTGPPRKMSPKTCAIPNGSQKWHLLHQNLCTSVTNDERVPQDSKNNTAQVWWN